MKNPKPLGGPPKRAAIRHTPFPGVIDSNRWTVKEGRWPSMIDRRDLDGEGFVMEVPLDGTPEDRKLRLHEQAHVAWTPNVEASEIEGVDPKILNATEDARMIQLMNSRNREWKTVNETACIMPEQAQLQHEAAFRRLGVRMQGGEEVPGEKVMSLAQAAALTAASQGYLEAGFFQQWCDNNNLGFIPQKVKQLHRKHYATNPKRRFKVEQKMAKKEKREPTGTDQPTFEDAIAYAKELEEYFDELEAAMNEAAAEMEAAEMPADIVQAMRQMMPSMPLEQLTETHEPDKQGWEDNQWGRMDVEQVPLPLRLRGDPSRKVRAVDIGAVPRFMHRLPVDQRIFGRRRKHRRFQGTLLIDLSGSMSLTPEEVEEILRRWPAVTIGTYSGTGGGYGKLRIIAKKGKRAGHEHLGPPAGGANEVDGPALDWLGRQRGPRVWISDGHVSGSGENFAQWFWLDAARKVNRFKIKRIPNVQELLRD